MQKRTFITIVLAVVLALATCMFAACGPKTPADQSGSQTEQGGTEQGGGSQEQDPPAHTHSAQFTAAKDPTCTADGNIAYWFCDGCLKYFRDEQCTDEIKGDIVVSATHHKRVALIEHVAQDPTCDTDGNSPYYECVDCQAYFWDDNAEREIEDKESIKLEATHHLRVALIEHVAQDPTCETDGNSLYYECVDCQAYFSDDRAEHKIENKASVKLNATHHLRNLQKHERKEATCTENGNARYWQCGDCQKYFDSEDATHEIQWSSIEIPAAHKFLAYETSETEHWHKCENCETEERAEHAFDESGACACGYGITVGLSYRIIDGETCAVSGIGTATAAKDIVIPAKINGRTVVGIDDFAFSEDSENIASITIPSGVVTIGQYVFQGCSMLKTLNWNATACTTAGSATVPMLDGCTTVRTIVVGDKVTSLPKSVFAGCSVLETITLPFVGDGTGEKTHIGWIFGADTYSENSKVPASLKTVHVTGGKSIGANAFVNCTSLTKIELPDTVTAIGANAFQDCVDLTDIRIPDALETVGTDAFSGCTSLVYKEFRNAQYLGNSENPYVVLVRATGTSITICTVHENTRVIYCGAFKDCNRLSEIDLPARVASIGNSAFENCTGLESVVIPDAVTSIGDYAFRGCTGLMSITVQQGNSKYHSDGNCLIETASQILIAGCNTSEIPTDGSVTSIGDYAFSGCLGLTSVTIPESITSIGTEAFRGCTNITTVTMPTHAIDDIPQDSLETVVLTSGESIAENAFQNCTTLRDITIPSSVTSIGSSAFDGCTGLTAVHITDIAAWCNIDFGNSYANPLYYAHHLYKDGQELSGALEIPNGVTKISAYAFYYCEKITSVTIPDSVTSIGKDAFNNCTGLTAVHIKDLAAWCNIDFGNSYANPLRYAHHLYKDGQELSGALEIPNGVTKISAYAFYYCEKISSVTIPDSVTSIGSSVFAGCKNMENMTIPFVGDKPHTSSDTYQYPFGYIFGTSSYGGGTATTQDYYGSSTSSTTSTTYYIPATLKTVTITGSKYIPYGAFYNCTGLESVTIGNGVTSIGDRAFYNCTGLESVTIGSGVTSIGNSAFYYCKGLTSVTIPDSVTSIGYDAFSGCTGLTSVTIPDSVTSIGEEAFYGCTNLMAATMPTHAIDDIPQNNLETVVLTSGTSIGNHAFYNCAGLTSVTIPESVTSIRDWAFYNCTGLTSVTIPASVTSIGDNAFSGCTGLEAVHITDLAAWCNIYFGNYSANPLYYVHHLYKDGTEIQDLEIPQGVTEIKDYAFYGCTGLTSVTIPASVTSIGEDAFGDCRSLTAVHITDIAAWCNIDCGNSSANPLGYAHHLYKDGTEIQDLEIPQGVTEIKDYAFYGCTGLTSVTIPASVTSIGSLGSRAFEGCYKLVEVFNHSTHFTVGKGYFGNGYVGYYALGVYNDATTQSKIVDKDGYLFYPGDTVYLLGYTGTDKVLVLPNDFEGKPYEIYQYAFYDRSDITSVTIGSSVTSLGDSAFEYCTSLTSVTIDSGVTSIGDYAFYKCTGITSVMIPDSVTSIGDSAFCGCTGLRSVTIGSGVTSIGRGAFYGCSGLTSAVFKNPSGWKVSENSNMSSASSVTVSYAWTAAAYLRDTYGYYYWHRY